ncbi:MAG: hypothetical protein NT120_00390 [Candidatus Aenigmarchaeota archaeon]|nr:hypothetical protein [Candidatus Aenigmarchaeota archaeon]
MKAKIFMILLVAIFIVSIIPAGLAYTDGDVESTMNKAAAVSDSTFTSLKTQLEKQYGKDSVRWWYMYINPSRKANCIDIPDKKTGVEVLVKKDIDRTKVKSLLTYFYDSADAASK